MERSMNGLRVERSTLAQVRPLIEGGHYLGKMHNRGRYAFALYQQGGAGLLGQMMLPVDDEPWTMVGAAVFGQPARETVAVSLWKDTEPVFAVDATLELTRFYTVDGLPPGASTWFLRRAVRLIPRGHSPRRGDPLDHPTIQMLVAFSDESAKNSVDGTPHFGGLYQAASWLYTGTSQSDHYHYEDKQGNRVAKQTPWRYAQRQKREDPLLADERPADGERRIARERGWVKVKDKPKYRYVLPLTRYAKARLALPPLDYPKPNE